MIKDIAFTAYPAADVRALREWYTNTLGLAFANPYEQDGVLMFDEAAVGGGWFSLMANEWLGVAGGSASGIAFEVEDVEKTKSELAAKGVHVPDIDDTPVCRVVAIQDAEGNSVLLHQAKAH